MFFLCPEGRVVLTRRRVVMGWVWAWTDMNTIISSVLYENFITSVVVDERMMQHVRQIAGCLKFRARFLMYKISFRLHGAPPQILLGELTALRQTP